MRSTWCQLRGLGPGAPRYVRDFGSGDHLGIIQNIIQDRWKTSRPRVNTILEQYRADGDWTMNASNMHKKDRGRTSEHEDRSQV